MTDSPPPSSSLAALTLRDAALLFSKTSGQPITPELLQADIEAGAPVNPDGTLHLVNYAAWLVKELNNSSAA